MFCGHISYYSVPSWDVYIITYALSEEQHLARCMCWNKIGFHVRCVIGCSNIVMFDVSCELVNIACLYCYRPDVRPYGVLLPWRRSLRQEQKM